jgi:uncharacterized protein (DUF362 family)
MDRRSFVKAGLGLSASAFLLPRSFAHAATTAGPVDLVAIRNGEPAAMFDKGIEALGGIRAFVKKGQKVLLKPNIGWDVAPERAGNTNPALVAHVIQRCLQAGAKEVYVFDHTCDNGPRCYRTSGIEEAVKRAGGKIAPGDSESYYQAVTVTGASTLTGAKEHELVLSTDVFINMPILKTHSSSRVTCCMKNLMGNVWDRGFWHGNDLHLCIAEYAAYRRPALNIVDAYNVMKRNGPRGVSVDDVQLMKAQIISTDMVAADAAATKLLGLDPEKVRHIVLAAERGVGKKDLDALTISRIAL